MPNRDRSRAVTKLFDQVSRIYDTPALQSLVYRPAQDEILAELRARGCRRIADVGCGTGILASRVEAELRPGTVVGFDASEGMLVRASERCSRVNWLLARAESLPLADGSLDAVVSSHAFHFFDQPAALVEFRRVLDPGGVLVIVIVNPRTPAGTRIATLSINRTGTFPDQQSMRQLVAMAGFTAVAQRRVRRGPFQLLSPDLVTIASA
jgi:ubiquinone/menaquinone biosynthesis C-methylase UbiE